MSVARAEYVEWMPAMVIYDPTDPRQVVMRIFFNPVSRNWAYRTYQGGVEKGVTKEHCMRVAQGLIGDSHRIMQKTVRRLHWSDKDKPADENFGEE